METMIINTNTKNEIIDLTGKINQTIPNNFNGICVIYTLHTTAAITINENADRDVKTDLIYGLNSLNFESLPFKHMEGNSPSHLKSSIIGCSETVIVENGKLQLGTWQGIFFCEFDGPRNSRKIIVKLISD